MAKDDKDGKKDKKPAVDTAGPLHVRIAKVFLERLAGAGGKAVASNPHVMAALEAIKAPIDKIIGTGSADAVFGSELFKAFVAGGVQLPTTFMRPMLARLLRVDESIADDVVQEGVDSAILSFLDETGNAAKGKKPNEQKEIIEKNADMLVDKVTGLVRSKNRERLRPVWFDSRSGLAHRPECRMLRDDDSFIFRKDDAGNDFTFLAAKKLGGRMTTECPCVGIHTDPAGTLDEARMRLDNDEREAFDDYLARMHDVRSEVLKKGKLAQDITVASLQSILKTTNPSMKRDRLLLLVGIDGKKPVKSPLERASDYMQQGLDVLTDKDKREKLNRDAKVATAGHRAVRSWLGRRIEGK